MSEEGRKGEGQEGKCLSSYSVGGSSSNGSGGFLLLVIGRMPRESLLVELDNDLWAARVGLASRDEVRLVCAAPGTRVRELGMRDEG